MRMMKSDCLPRISARRETTRYSPGNNKKNHLRHHLKMRPLDRIDMVVFQIKFNIINFRNKIFHVFSYVVHFSLSFL